MWCTWNMTCFMEMQIQYVTYYMDKLQKKDISVVCRSDNYQHFILVTGLQNYVLHRLLFIIEFQICLVFQTCAALWLYLHTTFKHCIMIPSLVKLFPTDKKRLWNNNPNYAYYNQYNQPHQLTDSKSSCDTAAMLHPVHALSVPFETTTQVIPRQE